MQKINAKSNTRNNAKDKAGATQRINAKQLFLRVANPKRVFM
jgi:hypothetical protein